MYYVAEVLSSAPNEVNVRYLSGSDAALAPDEIRTCRFRPGERITVNWPWWGPWTCSVVSYDAHRQRVELSDGWGSTKTFDIAEVWLQPPKKPLSPGKRKGRMYVTLMAAGSGIGAVVGSALTWLLMR
jgi:hypothetical protein